MHTSQRRTVRVPEMQTHFSADIQKQSIIVTGAHYWCIQPGTSYFVAITKRDISGSYDITFFSDIHIIFVV
jgi:hypothetical protein